MSDWLVIFAIGLGTYGLRASMFVVLGARPLPAWAHTPMSYVGPAAVGALLGSMLLTADGVRAPVGAIELVAVAAAFVTVRRTGNVIGAFAVGLPILWLAPAIAG